MKKVNKAVIPAAGLGTRFLPATKTIPKELLPIVDRPILLYIVEEAVRAGIEDIILISGRGKSAIEDFFDVSYELEDFLNKKGQLATLTSLKKIREMANIISIRQKSPMGLGHAIHCAKPIVGEEPFAVLLGDEIMLTDAEKPTVTRQLITSFEETGISTVSIMTVAKEDVCKYGMIKGSMQKSGLWKIEDVVEKPAIDKSPSQWALPGRYVFDNNIMNYLADLTPGKNGEIQLTDGMIRLAQKEGLHGLELKATRHDAGDKLGFLKANIDIGLSHPEIKQALSKYLKDLAKSL
ncbi:MAG: UTP--glucose-1-phosphate uridylyltransferase [Pseudomonadota bacterium]|nr:UTP--glucose-1-phosphate uridylyltransferase [Pseudomonadota bacterium]